MALSKVPSLNSPDRIVNQIQGNILNALNQIVQNPFLGGKIISDISIVSGDNTIPIGLSQPLTGWLVIRNNRNTTFYDDQALAQTQGFDPSQILKLVSSGICTISLFVF